MRNTVDFLVMPYSANAHRLLGHSPDVPDGASGEELFDLVDPDSVVLSEFTARVVDVAIQLGRAHERELRSIYVVGEHTFGPKKTATADLMKQKIAEDLHGVDTRVVPGESLNNTSMQIAAAAEIIPRDATKLTTLAYNFHSMRILKHAAAFGLKTDLEGVDPHTPSLNKYLAGFERQERLVRVLAHFDPTGQRLFNRLAERRGPQVDDLLPGKGEEYQLQRTTAHQRVLDLIEQQRNS